MSCAVAGAPAAPTYGAAVRLNRTNVIAHANRIASTTTSTLNHSLVTRSVAGIA